MSKATLPAKIEDAAADNKTILKLNQQNVSGTLAQEAIRLLHQPIIQLVTGVVAAETAEKAGLLTPQWAAIIQSSIIAMGAANLFKEAGFLGGAAAMAAGGIGSNLLFGDGGGVFNNENGLAGAAASGINNTFDSATKDFADKTGQPTYSDLLPGGLGNNWFVKMISNFMTWA